MTIADIVMLTATIIIWSLLIVNILLVIFGYVYYLKTDPVAPPPVEDEDARLFQLWCRPIMKELSLCEQLKRY